MLAWGSSKISLRLFWDHIETTLGLDHYYTEINLRLPNITHILPWDIVQILVWDYPEITLRLPRDYLEITLQLHKV